MAEGGLLNLSNFLTPDANVVLIGCRVGQTPEFNYYMHDFLNNGRQITLFTNMDASSFGQKYTSGDGVVSYGFKVNQGITSDGNFSLGWVKTSISGQEQTGENLKITSDGDVETVEQTTD